MSASPWVVAIALSVLAAPAHAEESTLRVSERVPIAVVVGTPTGETAQVRSSEVIRAVSDQLRAHTDFAIELMEAGALSECRGRLLCLVERAGRGRGSRASAATFLLVIANISREGEPDRLSAQLVDLVRADSSISRAGGSAEAMQEVEALLNDDAVTTERAQIAGPEDADRVIGEWVEHRFAQAFEHDGHWEPYGDILLEGTPEGLEVSLDGQSIGATGPGDTRVSEVRSGVRELVLVGPSIERYSTQIEVVRGDTVRLSPDLASTGGGGARGILLWGGAAVGLAGVVTTIVGVARHDGDVVTLCFKGAGCSSGSAFETSGFAPENANSLGSANGGGVYVVPLGLGLLGAGASWSVGTYLSEGEDVPWLPLIIGTGVGVLTYVLGATLSTRPEGS